MSLALLLNPLTKINCSIHSNQFKKKSGKNYSSEIYFIGNIFLQVMQNYACNFFITCIYLCEMGSRTLWYVRGNQRTPFRDQTQVIRLSDKHPLSHPADYVLVIVALKFLS